MPAPLLRPSLLDRGRILAVFLAELRRKAGHLALARTLLALGSPESLRRQHRIGATPAGAVLVGAATAATTYRALRRQMGPHRALASVRAAVLAGARAVSLPPPVGAAGDDPLEALAEALEATLAAGPDLGLYDVRWLDGPPGTVQLEVLRCRIHETCHAAGAPEVTSCFCDAEAPVLGRGDDRIVLVRDATIARGAPLCRFTFHVVDAAPTPPAVAEPIPLTPR